MSAFTVGTVGENPFIEGPPGETLLHTGNDVIMVLEECFAVPTHAVLLYAENLPSAFFDVSSKQAGEFLQKLRNYDIQVAVVDTGAGATGSQRYSELMAAERRDGAFRMFETREDAVAWLTA
ncbi:MAG: DUF4180 domain-containing protein [Gemmatimonadaceae bacterium]|nr:DUF4180 domain-containing protein [Gemmatimonadaceae bacterium]